MLTIPDSNKVDGDTGQTQDLNEAYAALALLLGPVSGLTTGSGGTSSTAEVEVGSFTIPSGQPLATTVYALTLHGSAASATSSQTIQLRIRLGSVTGTIIFDSGALTPRVTGGASWAIDLKIAFRSTGASGIIDCWGTLNEQVVAATAALTASLLKSLSIDTTANMKLSVTAQFSVSDASNTVDTINGAVALFSK